MYKAGFISGFIKQAKLLTNLLPHQKRILTKIHQQPGLILFHGLGSGKTLSSIAAIESLNKPTTVIAPAALIPNYKKEIDKHTQGMAVPDFVSIEMLARRPEMLKDNHGVLIVDEAHRIRSPKSKAHQAIKDSPAEKKLLLTATPMMNRPGELKSLKNVIRKTRQKDLVDYYDAGKKEYPDRIDERVNTAMSPAQESLYKDVLYSNPLCGTKLLPLRVLKKLEQGSPLDSEDQEALNNVFMGNTRQIANTINRYNDEMIFSPKIDKMVEDVKSGPGKTVMYSNYLMSGLLPLAEKLKEKKLKFRLFTGQQDKVEKTNAVKDFNDDKVDVLLLSSSGGEGIDLKGTRQIQIMEPHWNNAKIEQVIGRGLRYKSHSHLPPEEQNVLVKKYFARPSNGIGMDDYFNILAGVKDRKIKQTLRYIRKKMGYV